MDSTPKRKSNESQCRRESLRTSRGSKQKVVAVFDDGSESEIGYSDAEIRDFLQPAIPLTRVKRPRNSTEAGRLGKNTDEVSEDNGQKSDSEAELLAGSSQTSLIDAPTTPIVFAKKSKPRAKNNDQPLQTSTPVKHQKFYVGPSSACSEDEYGSSPNLSPSNVIPVKERPRKHPFLCPSPTKKNENYQVTLPFHDRESGARLNWTECKGKLLKVIARVSIQGRSFETEHSIYFPDENDAGWPVPQNTFQGAKQVEEVLAKYKGSSCYYPLSEAKQSRLGDHSTYLGFIHHVTSSDASNTRENEARAYGNLHIAVLCHWCVLKDNRRTVWIPRFRSLGTYDSHQSKQHKDNSGTNRKIYERECDGSRSYARQMANNIEIRRALIEAIISANLAHWIVDNSKIRKLFQLLNPNYNLPKRTTITRLVKQMSNDIWWARRRDFIDNADVIGGTIQIDGWSDRHRFAVLAIIFTYCDREMQFRRVMLTCKHHKVKSTGLNIAAFVKRELEINHLTDKVKFTITDSGANMVCAMKLIENEICTYFIGTEDERQEEDQTSSSDNDSEEWSTVDSDSDGAGSGKETTLESASGTSVELPDEAEAAKDIGVRAVPSKDENWGLSTLMSQNVCNVHKAQLIIKDVADLKNGCPMFAQEVKYINTVILFIRDHHLPLVLLKKLTGKTLRKYCKTRWNCVCQVLERLTEPEVFAAVCAIIKVAPEILKNKQKVKIPAEPTLEKFLLWQFLYHLLYPIMELTNQLQADGITAHLVIPTVIKAYLSIHQTPVHSPDWKEPKDMILSSFIKRFKPVCRNKVWIIASLMTYSSYTRNTFKWYRVMVMPLLEHDPFELPSEDEAIRVATEAIPVDARIVRESVIRPETKVKRRKILEALNTTYSDVENDAPGAEEISAATFQGKEIDVLSLYLLTRKRLYSRNFQARPPESCWNHFVKDTPSAMKLFNYMRQIYSLPASTACVERLFSQMGNIFSARRNRLQMKNVERIVLLKCALDDDNENFKSYESGMKLRKVCERTSVGKRLDVVHVPYDDSVTLQKIADFERKISKLV